MKIEAEYDDVNQSWIVNLQETPRDVIMQINFHRDNLSVISSFLAELAMSQLNKPRNSLSLTINHK